MSGSRSTGDPRRPHDRLWTLFDQLRDGFDAMEEEIDRFRAAGVMDGEEAEGLSAECWGERLDEFKGRAEELEVRIISFGDGAGGPADPAGAAEDTAASGGPAAPGPPQAWREGLMRARRALNRGTWVGPANDEPAR